jgi:hypothetical protein
MSLVERRGGSGGGPSKCDSMCGVSSASFGTLTIGDEPRVMSGKDRTLFDFLQTPLVTDELLVSVA